MVIRETDYAMDSEFCCTRINKDYVRNLRIKLKLTQKVFASILGVSKKTIEKWEQGRNPVVGPAARLLYLIDTNPEIIKIIYQDQ